MYSLPSYERAMVEAYCTGVNNCWKTPNEEITEAFYVSTDTIHGCIIIIMYISARNNNWPLAIFQPISTMGRPKFILVGQFYCTFSMGRQLITYKISCLQKHGRSISDSFLPLVHM